MPSSRLCPHKDTKERVHAHTHTHRPGVLLGRRLSTTVSLPDSATWRRPAHTLCVRRSGGREGKWAWERNRFPELFTLTSVCRTSSALSPSVSLKLHSVRIGGVDGLGSATRAPGPDGVNEMISPAHLKWTKTATRWTPAPFSWFWLFRSTPMASRGQQVSFAFICIASNAVGKFWHVDETLLVAKAERVWRRCQLCAPVPWHAAAFICGSPVLHMTWERGNVSNPERKIKLCALISL